MICGTLLINFLFIMMNDDKIPLEVLNKIIEDENYRQKNKIIDNINEDDLEEYLKKNNSISPDLNDKIKYLLKKTNYSEDYLKMLSRNDLLLLYSETKKEKSIFYKLKKILHGI